MARISRIQREEFLSSWRFSQSGRTLLGAPPAALHHCSTSLTTTVRLSVSEDKQKPAAANSSCSIKGLRFFSKEHGRDTHSLSALIKALTSCASRSRSLSPSYRPRRPSSQVVWAGAHRPHDPCGADAVGLQKFSSLTSVAGRDLRHVEDEARGPPHRRQHGDDRSSHRANDDGRALDLRGLLLSTQ